MLINLVLSDLLITGGSNSASAEVWLPGDRSCSLPRFPASGRQGHTQSSLTACGGGTYTFAGYTGLASCHTFDGEWKQSHSLSEGRGGHVSWQSPAGILLMGGWDSSTTTELLSTSTDTTTSNFSLSYETE